MRARRIVRAGLLVLLGAPFAPGGCSSDGIVGGECKPGYAVCNRICVSVVDDAKNCGGCDRVCDPGHVCAGARCVLPDASLEGGNDASADGDASQDAGDGSNVDGANPDGANPDGAVCEPPFNTSDQCGDCFTVCTPPNDTCGRQGDGYACVPTCTPPFDTAEHCGDCNTRCVPPNDVCAPSEDGGFTCVPFCDPNADPLLTECGHQCVDLQTDPFNCGSCGHICPTGICQAGKCVGASAGHMMLACSNYADAFVTSPQSVALGNAIFLRPSNPIRVLTYPEWATPANRTKVDALINNIAGLRGRAVTMTAASGAGADAGAGGDVVAKLKVATYDVFLMYDQPSAPSGALAALGTQLKSALASFTQVGGIVVVLDSGMGTAQMGAFMTNADLMPVSGESAANKTLAVNRAPGDAIGLNVLSPYLTPRQTCTFTTSAVPSSNTVFVVTPAPDAGSSTTPIIVHRVQAP